jgi:RND family efflux transporter MFP subunit
MQRQSITERSRAVLCSAGALLLVCWNTAVAQPVAVRVVKPEHRELVLGSSQPATAEPFYEADLGAKVSGYVSELFVDVGSRVTAGQKLARLAAPELVQKRNAARAEVAARQSEYERTVMLAERNSITQKSLTEAKAKLDMSTAAQAEVEAEMAYATIEAPFAGVVTARSIDPGDMVFQASSPKGSSQPLLRVAKLDVIRVKTYLPEREAVWADVGDAATIGFEALPGAMFAGKIARLSGSVDPATRTMLVEIDLPNEDGRIRPGLYGQVRLALERRDRALALPSTAIRYGEGAYVFVAVGEVARRTPIEIGLEVGGWVEILGGVNADAPVIANPPAALTDGAALRVEGG